MAKEPATAKRKPVLPQSEVADLARAAQSAWDTSEPVKLIDSLGAAWEFTPLRDENTRLLIQRFERGEDGEPLRLLASGQILQAEFGVDEAAAIIAAKINAVSDPADA